MITRDVSSTGIRIDKRRIVTRDASEQEMDHDKRWIATGEEAI